MQKCMWCAVDILSLIQVIMFKPNGVFFVAGRPRVVNRMLESRIWLMDMHLPFGGAYAPCIYLLACQVRLPQAAPVFVDFIHATSFER